MVTIGTIRDAYGVLRGSKRAIPTTDGEVMVAATYGKRLWGVRGILGPDEQPGALAHVCADTVIQAMTKEA